MSILKCFHVIVDMLVIISGTKLFLHFLANFQFILFVLDTLHNMMNNTLFGKIISKGSKIILCSVLIDQYLSTS